MDLRFSIRDWRFDPTSPERQLRVAARVSPPSRQAQHAPELPLGAGGRADAPVQSAIGNRQSATAFTLIELLLSMFILAIGMVAIASIFPVAGYLQKNAFADVLTLQVKRQAVAIVGAVDLPDSALPSGPGDVEPVNNLDTHFPLQVRAYPQVSNRPIGQRQFYWVPLVQDVGSTDAPDYRYYAFILERSPDATYTGSGAANGGDVNTVPKVVSAPASGSGSSLSVTGANGEIEAGDQLLGSNGQIFQVAEVENTTVTIAGEIQDTITEVWYGKPATGLPSPTRRIIAFGGEASQ